ncbi:hypothetical protein HGM15179_017649 [Zosterops borbonicus]|uniref:Gag-Pol polyprotein n=1 Tax=Zosterops borbonicus TaxID=364589 RepID=A0A8K1G0M0_9PASS|nr:hypothetical protein HGM15179_017649 [Zosterops borbonicus]
MMGDEWGENESEGHNLLPLREVPTAPGVIGFVNVPLNTGDVRAFKKEMGRLLDDPFGVADRLDEFLGSSIYTYEDRMAILRSLFNNEEREMIKQAGIRDWDRRNPQGTPGDQKWPSSSPSWNAQTEDGRRSMVDLRNIIIQGIREAVPRGQNISKAFNECQGKEESPTEWIERLRRSLQIYSGTDPDSPVGEVLLKTQFVAKSWEDIRRKLEKIDGWQDKSLQELLREAQKVYMRREDEKQKVQAKVLVAAVKEVQRQEQASDTGAERSTLQHLPKGCIASKESVMVVGAKGDAFRVPVIENVEIESENKICLGNLLLVEEAEYNLLGRDMIIELGISVIVKSSDLVVKMFKLTEKDEVDINPKVWHSKGEVGRLEIDPIHIAIENPEDPIRVKQYPIPLEGRKGLKQADGSYRLVQDLRAVNARTRTRFPVVANPYTLLNRLTPEDVWYSVIDLKDAFWTCPLDEKSRDYFAFQWEDPDTNRKQQLRWTVLPQGFVESPNLFGQALEQLLTQFTPREGTKLLQCVDDLLIAGPTEESVRECTVALLNFTGDKDLKVSKSKLQFMEPEEVEEAVIPSVWEMDLPEKSKLAQPVHVELKEGASAVRIKQYPIRTETRQGIAKTIDKFLKYQILEECESECNTPIFLVKKPNEPQNLHELQIFLGMAGWCRLWIMDYGLIVEPLYEAQKMQPFTWGKSQREAFQKLKEALTTAPALGLPDLSKDFQLYVHERQRLALGVLTQRLGSWKRPVGYFSKQLDNDSSGSYCAADTRGQEAHDGKTHRCLCATYGDHSSGAKGDPLALSKQDHEQDDVTLKTTNLLNPALFLGTTAEESPLEHDCVEVIEHTYAARAYLKDVPLEQPEWELFTDGSSFMENGIRYTGYAVTTVDRVVEAKALPPSTSAQRAEMVALTRALELSKGKMVNIWTDSKYAFGVVHVHGALWKERGLLSSQGTRIKHQDAVLQLLSAVQKPEQVAIMHCKTHQPARLRSVLVWNRPLTLENPVHDIKPGDEVYTRAWKEEPLKERWTGSHQVLLTTFTAVKVAGVEPWIH